MFKGLNDPVHFVGIAGYGMSGLAELCLKSGLKVSGSDLRTNELTAGLEKLGAKIYKGHSADYVAGAKTVVYTSAVDESNPEIAAAKSSGVSLIHRSDLLALSFKGKKAITVAGTHGKTTTTAMLGYMLERYGLDPTIVCGGTMNHYNSNVFAGKSEYIVAEADESDGTFLKYSPFVSVITNIDYDHMEFFKNKEGLCSSFLKYATATDKDGCTVVGWDSGLVRDTFSNFPKTKLAYGFLLGSEVRATGHLCKDGVSSFQAIVEKDLLKCELNMFGRHNVQNALCCLSVAKFLKLDLKKVADILQSFPGVKRRQEVLLKTKNLIIMDDYAHNPGKIESLVTSIKASFADKKLYVAFQPHRYSRLETMYDQMIGSVKAADRVFVLPVYTAGETTTQDFSPGRLAKDIEAISGHSAVACNGIEAAIDAIQESLPENAVVLSVGAGDVYAVVQGLRDRLS